MVLLLAIPVAVVLFIIGVRDLALCTVRTQNHYILRPYLSRFWPLTPFLIAGRGADVLLRWVVGAELAPEYKPSLGEKLANARVITTGRGTGLGKGPSTRGSGPKGSR